MHSVVLLIDGLMNRTTKTGCVLMQTHVHGDERSSEDSESHRHQHDGRSIHTRPRVNLLIADHCLFTHYA